MIDALKLMADKEIGALVVIDRGRLAGILSERDYARKVILKGKSPHDIPVREIMTEKVLTVQPGQSVTPIRLHHHNRRYRGSPDDGGVG